MWELIWSNDEFDAHARNGVIRMSRRAIDGSEDPEASFWVSEDLMELAVAAEKAWARQLLF